MDTTPLSRFFEATLLFATFLYTSILIDAEWRSLMIAVGGSVAGAAALEEDEIVGVGHGLGEGFAGLVILLIAFVKVRFVGRYFMELRHAPLGLAAAFDAWIVVVAATLIGLFLA